MDAGRSLNSALQRIPTKNAGHGENAASGTLVAKGVVKMKFEQTTPELCIIRDL
jgi:hypothetical protein